MKIIKQKLLKSKIAPKLRAILAALVLSLMPGAYNSPMLVVSAIEKADLKTSGWVREDAANIANFYTERGATNLTANKIGDLIDWYNGSEKIKTLIQNYTINNSYFDALLSGNIARPSTLNDSFIARIISLRSSEAESSFKNSIDSKINELNSDPNAGSYANIIDELEKIKNSTTGVDIANNTSELAEKIGNLVSKEALEAATSGNPLDQEKTDAKNAIDQAANEKKAAIDANNSLTTQEKEAAKAEVDEEARKAKEAIDAATTTDEVNTAKNNGITAINNVPTEGTAKTDTKNAIDQAANEKKAAIDANNNLTTEEKEAAKASVDEEARKAKEAIDAATTTDEVNTAKNNGITAINNISEEGISKTEAKNAIDQTADKKKSSIDNSNSMTKAEKQVAKAKVDEEARKAKEAIDAATTIDGVNTAKNDGITAINKISEEGLQKYVPAGNIDLSSSVDNAVPNRNNANAGDNKTRVSGNDRVETSIEVSKKFFGKSKKVIIARADLFPDSLTASVLSKVLNAPILLTGSDKLDQRVADEIKRLGAEDVIIVGGNVSITDNVKKELSKFDKDSVERLAGVDRYATSAEVARYIMNITGQTNTAVIASGEVFADSLSISPFAAKNNYPILLVKKNLVPKSIQDIISQKNISRTYVIGGTDTISVSVEKSLPGVIERIGGVDRYETATMIAKSKHSDSKDAFLASGEKFADALVIGGVAGNKNVPILLSKANKVVDHTKKYIDENISGKITVIGGMNSVSEEVLSQLLKK